jgi:hypothetical protein
MEHDAVRVADMGTGRELWKLAADGPVVFAFSADSLLLAVAGRSAVRLWETASWKEVGSIRAPGWGADRPCAAALAFAPDGRTLTTGHADGTILLWDATLRGGTRGGALTAAQREALWADLAGADAARGYSAVWRLADDPRSAALLKGKLRPVVAAPPAVVRSLLDDLDSDDFAVRQTAERKLRELGERAGSALREALKAKPSLEKWRRIKAVLAALESVGALSGEALRGVRAVHALERLGSAEARGVLEGLARGVESARLTRDANEALGRLKGR